MAIPRAPVALPGSKDSSGARFGRPMRVVLPCTKVRRSSRRPTYPYLHTFLWVTPDPLGSLRPDVTSDV